MITREVMGKYRAFYEALKPWVFDVKKLRWFALEMALRSEKGELEGQS